MGIEVTEATDGALLPLDSLEHAWAGSPGAGSVTDTVVFAGTTYVQTYTYVASALTNISRWVRS